mmetsp:Transcript_14260/g.29183  ORF Transcript_14260/g.29183 Transcript_14260/m.29183 type:complete len:342 (-) Transcript_14260:1114-2139(-)
MYILGGFQFNEGNNFAQTDMYAFDLEMNTWSIVLMTGEAPDGLQGHRAVLCGDAMYILGGKVKYDDVIAEDVRAFTTGLNSKMYQFRFDISKWFVVPCAGKAPCPRQLHAVVAVPSTNSRYSVFVFGGTDRLKTVCYGDLAELRGIRDFERLSMDNCLMCSNMDTLLNKELFADVVFVVEGKRIFAHRCILFCRSDYFRRMFNIDMREQTQSVIEIKDVSYSVLLLVLEFLYTGKVDFVDGQQALEVLKAADMFQVDGLRGLCVDKVEQAVTTENAAFLCELAESYGERELKSFCISYIVSHFRDCISSKTFLELMRNDPEGLGYEILLAFSDHGAVMSRT